jgi:predicted acyl esterase
MDSPASGRLADVAPAFLAALSDAVRTPPAHKPSDIRRQTVQVAMRDGILLATDLYLPPDLPAPIIALRTPYGRRWHEEALTALAQRGYLIVSQDVRGTGDSEPDSWEFYIYEREDSFDFIQWVVRQSWYGGFIGALGGSYVGGTQWCMAMHPRMSAIAPEVAGLGIAPSNGVRFHLYVNSYSRSVGKGAGKVSTDRVEMERQMREETLASGYFAEPLQRPFSGALLARYPALGAMAPAEARRWLWQVFAALPPEERAELIKLALDEEIVTFASTTKLNGVFGHDVDPDALMYPGASVPALCRSIQAPALMITGWYDWCLGDALYSWEQLVRHGNDTVREQSRLLITASAHNAPGYHEGREQHAELDRTYRTGDNLELLLHWYAAARQGAFDALPKVTYYLMGANEWRTAAAWPPPEAKIGTLFLRAEGTLSLQTPREASASDTYTYDPADPTPTLGGSILSNIYPPGSVDVSEAQKRADVLTYTTGPLQSDLDMVGPLRLVLYAASSAPDTDFYGRLSDVFPDGRTIQLQSGMVRARYRNAASEPEALTPGRIYRLDIDMWATANRFCAGHRLRLDISSADFPKFERNDNRAGEPGAPLPAVQTIYRDREHASHLLLPVMAGALG